jgi:NDP-sugar pyrophosphorylase family protein
MPPLALLAGGLSTRLRPTTYKIPKSMVEVAGEPFIAHLLRLLQRERIQKIVICTGYLGDQIKTYVGDGAGFGCHVCYSSDGERLLGTGGALRKALSLFEDHFFVMYGDTYLDIDFQPVYAAFLRAKLPALMTVLRNTGRWDTSNVEFADGAVRRYDKLNRTRAMQYIDYGLSVLSTNALERWPMNTLFDLGDLYRDLAERGQLAGHEVYERFYEIGSPTGLAETAAHLSGKIDRPNT